MKKIVAFFALIMVIANTSMQAQNCAWAKAVGGDKDDFGQSVFTDANNNVYLVGFFRSATITFGTITLTNADITGNTSDIYIAKYDSNGNVLWANSTGGTDDEMGQSVCSDASDNVYLTGKFQSPSITFGTTTLTNTASTQDDIFIVKYASNGNVLWAKSAGGNNEDYSNSIATDINENVYLTGGFKSSSISFGANTLSNLNVGTDDIFVVKYDPNGNALWANSHGGTGYDYGKSLSTDVSGNIYLTGSFWSTSITFGTTTLSTAGAQDIFIVKYNSNGIVQWVNSAGGPSTDDGLSTSTDANGNVYVSGSFLSNAITFGTFNLSNPMNGISQIFIVKYTPNGTVLWVKSEGGNSDAVGASVATDANNNVYLTGYFSASTITFGNTTLNNSGVGSDDIYISKYASDGAALWASSAGGNSMDRVNSICSDANGNIYIAGFFYSSTITFGTNSLTSAGGSDLFIAKYAGNYAGEDEVSGNKEVHIFPNPTHSVFTISIPTLKNSCISIINLTGAEVGYYQLQSTNRKIIDVSHLDEGVYFLVVKNEEGVIAKKIIKTN